MAASATPTSNRERDPDLERDLGLHEARAAARAAHSRSRLPTAVPFTFTPEGGER